MIKRKRIGYFGGTFDPPHVGHLILAREALIQLDLDNVRWILTPYPPHKTTQQVTPLDFRMEMLRLVVDPYPDFQISTIDIDREPPHFAADTVELIKEAEPQNELFYIIGQDSLRDLPDWRDTERFLSLIDCLVVAPRPGISTDLSDLESDYPDLSGKVRFLEDIQIEISSSRIRSRISENTPAEHFLPSGIYHYILNNGLYK